jgi:hypothetical protein
MDKNTMSGPVVWSRADSTYEHPFCGDHKCAWLAWYQVWLDKYGCPWAWRMMALIHRECVRGVNCSD